MILDNLNSQEESEESVVCLHLEGNRSSVNHKLYLLLRN